MGKEKNSHLKVGKFDLQVKKLDGIDQSKIHF
jgi:hypothetical protein